MADSTETWLQRSKSIRQSRIDKLKEFEIFVDSKSSTPTEIQSPFLKKYEYAQSQLQRLQQQLDDMQITSPYLSPHKHKSVVPIQIDDDNEASNTATPIYKSTDGIVWTTRSTALTAPSLALNSVAYGSGYYVAVGDGITNSANTTTWTTKKTYDTVFEVTLYGTAFVTTTGYTGFVAVGKGLRYDYTSGLTQLVPTNIISYSSDEDGNTWSDSASITPYGLNAVASNGTIAIAVGENNVIYQTSNGADWTGVNEVLVTGINSATDRLGVASTAGFTNADPIQTKPEASWTN